MNKMIATVILALMMNVGAGSIQSCLFLPNMDLEGGTYDEFATTEIKECCKACSSRDCCVAYTFDALEGRCYLKSAIGASAEDTTKTSGLRPNSYYGQGVKLKNVKIYGDNTNIIELRNRDECREYCTAYQVFTYAPPRSAALIGKGECTCSMRIKSLKYSFGCVSEIVPTSQ